MSDILLRDYLKQVEAYFKAGIATEHTYRPALQQLLAACADGISVTNEPKRVKSEEHMWQHIVALAQARNARLGQSHWRFTCEDARAQMHDLYPFPTFQLD